MLFWRLRRISFGLSGHATLDDWGLPLLWPFSDRRWVFPMVRWGDAVPTAIFVAGMFAMVRWPGRREWIALPLGLVGIGLMPALVGRTASVRVVTGLAGLVLAVGSAWMEGPGPGRPEPSWLNVRSILVVDRDELRCEVSTFGAALPEALAAAAPFERASAPPFPWLSLDSSLYATAPIPGTGWDVPAPGVGAVA